MAESAHIFWKKTRDEFSKSLRERNTFNRIYLRMQEYDYTKDLEEDLEKIIKEQKPRLDYWRPYIHEAINHYIGKSYILSTYSDTELENIISLMDEAIEKNYLILKNSSTSNNK